VDCPPGYYCPSMTEYGSEFACPKGMFQNISGQAKCRECLPGMYCPRSAMVYPTVCPPGFYCPAGLSNYSATPCPRGTFSSALGLQVAAECINVSCCYNCQ
jgi:hypothetical protein